jgi:pyruvate dehydrogenase E2 component (dihydrolipoamide acetyltransferase)
MAEFVMPSLGADMEAGTLVAWLKKPGEAVKKGDIIAEVETDKGIIEIESFMTGLLEKTLVEPMTKVPVGTALAIIREEGKPSAEPKPAPPVAGAPPQPAVAPVSPTPQAPVTEPGRLRVSPSAKQLAAELGVDLILVKGTGPGGGISRDDVLRVAEARGTRQEARGGEREPPIAPSPVPRAGEADDRLLRMRQAIAAAMARSKREIPHYYVSTTIDMSKALAWLTEENLKRPTKDRLLYGVLLLKAVALALREVPELNARWKGNDVVRSDAIHVGVAISLRSGGLVAPALHDTDGQRLDDLMRNFRDLVTRARAGGLRSSELSDPTITVTSLGEQGVESVYAVIYPPQVAIVGFGKMVERPWVVDKQIVPRSVLTATLSADHRVTDGHRGGLFLAAVDRLLQEPGRL